MAGGAAFPCFDSAGAALVIVAGLLFADALAGPLRYFLAAAGLEGLIYLPKVACLAFAASAIRLRMSRHQFGYIVLFCWFTVIGLLHGTGPAQGAFSLFLVAPFLFGITAASLLRERARQTAALFLTLFAVTAAGIYLDVWLDFPWKGFSYSIGGAEVEASREWTAMGIDRLAGFTRMSASAAFYLVCTALFLVRYLKVTWQRWVVALAAMPAVVLTTNKAGIGAFLVGLTAMALSRRRRLLAALAFGFALAVVVAPLSTAFRDYRLDMADPVSLLLFASLEDRLTSTWPGFFDCVARFGNPVTGVGFGGVGSAAKMYAAPAAKALAVADNFFMYLYGCFGVVVAVLLLLLIARIVVRLSASADRFARSFAPPVAALLAAALTTDVIEAQVFALFLGISVACAERLPPHPERR